MRRPEQAGYTKIENLDFISDADHYVGGFDIAMNDALAMRVIDRHQYLAK